MSTPATMGTVKGLRGRRHTKLTLALCSLALLGISTAMTQYLAAAFNYHDSLPGHIGSQWYWPWSWAVWVWKWGASGSESIRQTIMFGSSGSLAIFGAIFLAMSLRRRRGSAVSGLHGTAHWATREEVEASGLLASPSNLEGVYVGGWQDAGGGPLNYLRHSGPEHVLSFAPTRSGKGVGLVLPTLLSWPGSVVCYDIKGENWAHTSGWRKQHGGNVVIKFEPTASDGSSASFNPLEEIRLGEDEEVADAQNIATILVDPDGKGLNDHWAKTSFALLTGAILHCCYERRAESGLPATLADVGALLADPEREIEEVLEGMLFCKHVDGQPHAVVAQEARAMLNKDKRELSSVVSTAISFLTLYRDPLIARQTARSDFRIKDLVACERPVSLYLVVRPSDADRLRPLVRLMLTQIVRRLTERLDFQGGVGNGPGKHRLLMMLDEFASLKKLSVIQEGLAVVAGYGIKMFLIVQDLEQIHGIYGQHESIVGNCHVRIAYAPNKLATAELLSRMSGQTTIIHTKKTVSGKRTGLVLGQVNETIQEVQRPLLTADEAMRLPMATKDESGRILEPGHMLVFVAGQAPIYGRQILYFRDPTFLARAGVPAPEVSDRLRHVAASMPAVTEPAGAAIETEFRLDPLPLKPTRPRPLQAPEPEQADEAPSATAQQNQPRLAHEKTWLKVPYKEREQAKKLGARWDREEKAWFAPKGTDLNPLSEWLPSPAEAAV